MATRLYFPKSLAANVSPAFHVDWYKTSGAIRRTLATSKVLYNDSVGGDLLDGSPLGITLLAQYISLPLLGDQTVSGTVKMYTMCYEANAADAHSNRLGIRIFSNDGLTQRGICLAVANYSPGTEFMDVTARNKISADGDTLTSINALDGDKIVLEIGVNTGSGASPQGAYLFNCKSAQSDLPENETEVDTNLNPWIEFSANLLFKNPIPALGGAIFGQGF